MPRESPEPEPGPDIRRTSYFGERSHYSTGYSGYARRERKAWRSGEDPTDWKASRSTTNPNHRKAA